MRRFGRRPSSFYLFTKEYLMSLLNQVQSGRAASPPRLLVYGTEGIGKSTLAARAPQHGITQSATHSSNDDNPPRHRVV